MRYFTKIIAMWDGTRYVTVSYRAKPYNGRWDYCKGDPTAQAAEQHQAKFDDSLMSMMQAQYGKQSAITSYLTNKMEPQINAGGVGVSPNALAADRTNATDVIARQYQNATRSTSASEAHDLPSGVNAQISGQLASGEASDIAGSQNEITLQNEQLKQQNYWNSINVLNGQAATENPLGYASAATAGSGAISGLSQAVTAANGPTFGAVLGGIAGGIGTAAAGYFTCPAEGSKYLMADGTEKLVEELVVGDRLQGIDGEAQTIEEIQHALSDIIQVVTEAGFVTHNSPTHAFALPKGGFTVSAKALGKTIVTARGTSKVISIRHVGQAVVFNIITDGSHTYRADGVWALGVGEAERHVSMASWKEIGKKLMTEAA